MAVLDATDQVMGRLASILASRLLAGEEIHVVNAEKAVVTGDRLTILKEYRTKKALGSTAGRMRGKGPYFPRRPDRIVKRAVRGMLPYQQPRGRDALKRLKVYVGVPEEFAGASAETPEAKPSVHAPHITVGEISEHLGASF